MPKTTGEPQLETAAQEDRTDRLVVEGSQEPVGVPTDPRLTGELDAREAQLVTTIDRTINLQIELDARIRRLEEIQLAIRAQLESPPEQLASAPSAAPATPSPRAEGTTPPVRDLPAPQARAFDWALWLALFGAVVLLTLLWKRIGQSRADGRLQRARQHDATRAAAPLWPKDAPTDVGERAERIDDGTSAKDDDVTPRPAKPFEWDGSARSTTEPETAPPLITATDDAVEEHDSAVELADIMMSFGRLHGAAETLAEFIRSNPKQAITPWLKLMEVYRAADMRPEFDALARQLNKTFNVKTVTWENFEQSRTLGGSLESMPHIIEHLQKTWGSRDCQAYIEKIVRDNRDGTRQGFPLAVVDELLALSAVLEEQLGRYRPVEAA